jgi:ribosome-binding ATPase YchF (GTP1/OBG family)
METATPETAITDYLFNALVTYVPDKEIRLIADEICLIVATAIDAAVLNPTQRARASEEVSWAQTQWRACARQLRELEETLHRCDAELRGAHKRERALVERLAELGHEPPDLEEVPA